MKINKTILLLFVASAILFVFERCENDDKKELDLINLFDREAMLENMADNYILPAYSSYVDALGSLKTAAETYESNPDASTLNAFQDALYEARLVWQDVAFLEFGPAANDGLNSQTNLYPVDTALVNQLKLQSDANLASVSNFNAKGFEALDFLAFTISAGDVDAIPFIHNVISDLLSNAQAVESEWTLSYKSSFVSNSSDNSSGSGVAIILNGLSQHYESYIRKGKLGVPSGAFNGFSGQILPEQVEAYYSGKSTDFLVRSMKSFEKFYLGNSFTNGTEGLGLDDYIEFVGTEKDGKGLDIVVNDQFSSINTALQAIDGSVSDAVQNDKTDVDAAYAEMQKLVPLLKVDVTAALGVLITYQDTDGD